MTLYDLIMSCDNVLGRTKIEVYSSGNTIAPIKTFTLGDFLNDNDYYELSMHIEITHFEFYPNDDLVKVWVYTSDKPIC